MASQEEMLEAGAKLVEYKEICHNYFVALSSTTVQRLRAAYKRHLVLVAPVGLFVSKHHVMLHLLHQASSVQPRLEARADALPPAFFFFFRSVLS